MKFQYGWNPRSFLKKIDTPMPLCWLNSKREFAMFFKVRSQRRLWPRVSNPCNSRHWLYFLRCLREVDPWWTTRGPQTNRFFGPPVGLSRPDTGEPQFLNDWKGHDSQTCESIKTWGKTGRGPDLMADQLRRMILVGMGAQIGPHFHLS